MPPPPWRDCAPQVEAGHRAATQCGDPSHAARLTVPAQAFHLRVKARQTAPNLPLSPQDNFFERSMGSTPHVDCVPQIEFAEA